MMWRDMQRNHCNEARESNRTVLSKSLFRQHEKLKDWHIALPDVVQLQYDFEDKYQTMFNDIALNEDEFVTLYQEWQEHEK